MSSTSEGTTLDVKTNGASCVAPLVLGKNCLEKFSSPSSNNETEASSPSQSLLVAACSMGWANNPCVCENPRILPTMAAEVWGASTITKWPTKSCDVLRL